MKCLKSSMHHSQPRRSPARALAFVAAAALALVPSFAAAVRTPRHLATRASTPLELAAPASGAGRSVRAFRQVRWDRPSSAGAAAWARFRGRHGHGWRALFDGATGTPLRLFGAGIPAPGASADAAVAERAARALLAEQIDLLAPGARPSQFVVVANVFDARTGQRSIGMVQTSGGTRVLGGQVSFSFKNDRLIVIGSTAIPYPPAPGARRVDDSRARSGALAWVGRDFQPRRLAPTGVVDGPFLLPLVDDQGVQAVRHVLRVTVEAQEPIGRWQVYVDAATGEPVAREQTLHFADGTLELDVPNRWPENGRVSRPARALTLEANGNLVTTDETGKFSFIGTVADVVVTMTGTQVVVTPQSGALFSASKSVNAGASVTVSGGAAERTDAQVAAFVFAREAKDRGKIIARIVPELDPAQGARERLVALRLKARVGDVISPLDASWEAARAAPRHKRTRT